ncbi:uncharacterized protein [Musca autumnalis]|uniref:uncharacterized protein n=1 Tax=Musca autumnalis TaxID=221902 RepID=UPI003CF94550
MADAKPKFSKLNNDNYANWKFKMELLLRKHNLWKLVIEGSRPEPKRGQNNEISNQAQLDEWDAKDDEARGTIGLLVMDDQLGHIRNMKTAKDTWNALKEYHERNTLTNKVYLMRSICSLKLEEGGDAVAHINAMNDLFTKLRDVGEEALSDKWSAAMLLSSLPEGYDTLITSLESRKEEEVTFAFVQQRVIAEYERRVHSGNCGNDVVMKATSKTEIVCYFCKKPGHQKKNCMKYKSWKNKQGSAKNGNKINTVEEIGNTENMPDEFLFKFGKNKKFTWLVDSGATRHAVSDKNFFNNLDENYKSSIELANGDCVSIKGIGSGEIKTIDEFGNEHTLKVKEVLYAPSLVDEKRRKLDIKATEMIFIGYDCKSKAFRCYNPSTNKVTISRDVIFTDIVKGEADEVSVSLSSNKKQLNNQLLIEEEKSDSSFLNESAINNSSENSTLSETPEGINNSSADNTFYETPVTQHNVETGGHEVKSSSRVNKGIPPRRLIDEISNVETNEKAMRTSSRSNKGIAPKRFVDEIWSVNEVMEPKTYKEAIESEEKVQWLQAMQEEIEAMKNNKTWELATLPEGRSAIGCKWIYKLKRNENGDICRFKARLVAQGFSQKYGVDYDEVFAPVATHTSFRILLSIAGKENLIVNHLDVKTAFLNGKLTETIYMQQPPGFKNENEELELLNNLTLTDDELNTTVISAKYTQEDCCGSNEESRDLDAQPKTATETMSDDGESNETPTTGSDSKVASAREASDAKHYERTVPYRKSTAFTQENDGFWLVEPSTSYAAAVERTTKEKQLSTEKASTCSGKDNSKAHTVKSAKSHTTDRPQWRLMKSSKWQSSTELFEIGLRSAIVSGSEDQGDRQFGSAFLRKGVKVINWQDRKSRDFLVRTVDGFGAL